MSRKQPEKKTYPALKKKAVYSLIANAPKGVNFHTIQQIFGSDSPSKKPRLHSIIKNLKRQRHIHFDSRSRRYFATTPTSPLMVVRARKTENGIELTPIRWSMAKASQPKMRVKKSDTEYKNIQDGDKLLIAIQSTKIDRTGKKLTPVSECAVISKIDVNAPVEIRAIFKKSADGKAGLVPTFRSTKGVYTPIDIDKYEGPYSERDYPDNALVMVRINERKSQHDLCATVTDLADWDTSYPADLLSLRDKANGMFRDSPYSEDEEMVAAVAASTAPKPKTYTDMRNILQFAVDPVDAKDHDDAISAVPDTAPDNKDGWIVTVSDIDVVRLVTQMRRAIDNALEHPLSAYTNDSVIHMLPKSWAEDAASLKDRQERFCVSIQIRINAHGEKLDHQLFRSLNAPYQISYADMDQTLHGQAPSHFTDEMIRQIEHISGAYEALVIEDSNRGTLNFEQPKIHVEKDDEGRITAITAQNGSISRDIIKKFMILANRAFREECARLDASTIDRVEATPNIQHRLPKKIAPSNGEALFLRRDWSREEIRSVLETCEDHPAMHRAISDLLVRKVMRPGKYSTDEIGHFGLALDDEPYASFNSPVRSLADLSNMMSLFDAKGWLQDYTRPGHHEWLQNTVFGPIAQKKITDHLNTLQPQYKALQRNATRRQAIAFLNRYQGKTVDARIEQVTERDVTLQIADCAFPFTFSLQSFSGGVFKPCTSFQSLTNSQTNQTFIAGDALPIKLTKADPLSGQISLTAMIKKHERKKSSKNGAAVITLDNILVAADILEATTKRIRIQIGDKPFDVTNALKGSKSMRQGGLYHYDSRLTLSSGTTRYFRLTFDKSAAISECKPTNSSFIRETKAYKGFIKAHGIRLTAPQKTHPPQTKQEKWRDFSTALAGLMAQPQQIEASTIPDLP
ncbi:MAG: RNB domain-containing ribonuclease [Alphaproteobacteria bacterium]